MVVEAGSQGALLRALMVAIARINGSNYSLSREFFLLGLRANFTSNIHRFTIHSLFFEPLAIRLAWGVLIFINICINI